jgi:hyperosmotically inducible periplasmic protein
MKNRILVACALSAVVALGVAGTGICADKDTTPSADNTRMNKQMQENKEMTADQQSENAADRKLSQRIRRAVVKDKSLSKYAHNVKIITRNGAVTLKGPVRTEEEKMTIEKIAARVAGKGKITNEIEVAPKK